MARSLEREPRRYRVSASPGWTYIDVLPAWFDLTARFDAAVNRRLTLGGGLRYYMRDFGNGSLHDLTLQTHFAWRFADRWTLSGGLGATPVQSLAALFDVWIEPSHQAARDVSIALRYWMLRWKGVGAHVLVPSLRWTPSPFSLDARYYLSFTESGDVTHAGLLRLGLELVANLSAQVGVGAGDRTDYLDIASRDTEWHWLVLGELQWRVHPDHRLAASYTFIDEREVKQRFQRHRFALSWVADF